MILNSSFIYSISWNKLHGVRVLFRWRCVSKKLFFICFLNMNLLSKLFVTQISQITFLRFHSRSISLCIICLLMNIFYYKLFDIVYITVDRKYPGYCTSFGIHNTFIWSTCSHSLAWKRQRRWRQHGHSSDVGVIHLYSEAFCHEDNAKSKLCDQLVKKNK